MSYAALFFIIIIFIITIVVAILFTIAIDNLARVPDTTDSFNNMVLDTTISIGTFVVIFLIFLIALDLTIGILAYYSASRNTQSNFAFYMTVTLIIATIGLIILEFYTYSQVILFKRDPSDTIVSSSINMILWGIILTIIALILSFILLALI